MLPEISSTKNTVTVRHINQSNPRWKIPFWQLKKIKEAKEAAKKGNIDLLSNERTHETPSPEKNS
jgi:predicted deacetylase